MTAERYSTVAIVLHWTIALLLIAQIAGGLFMTKIPDEQAAFKFDVYQLHKSFGVTILVLTLFRLGWRLTHMVPPLPADMPAWERLAARGTHWLFYALLIVIPLLGWAYVSAAPLSVPTVLFGVIPWPDLPLSGEATAEFFEESHELAAKLAIGLIFLHVAAALKHHFINKDNVLANMAPIFRRSGS